MKLFVLLVPCVCLCAVTLASPPALLNIEASRSGEFFRLGSVSDWLATHEKQQQGALSPRDRIFFGDFAYWQGNHDEAALSYKSFLKEFGNDKAAGPLIALIRDKLAAVYILAGKQELASEIIGENGKRVTFGDSSRILYQEHRTGSCQVTLTSNLYSIAKVINDRNGRLEAVVWLVPPRSSWGETAVVLNLPDGVYQVLYAHEVRKDDQGQYHALAHGRRVKPLHLHGPLAELPEVGNDDLIETSADIFGSFRPIESFEQQDNDLIHRSLKSYESSASKTPSDVIRVMRAELEEHGTSALRKKQLESLISSYAQWSRDRGD